jgi:hypothetical protein
MDMEKYACQSVQYHELHAYTIEAIKELTKLVGKQQEQIDELKQQLEDKK